jgi:hypothetical protein
VARTEEQESCSDDGVWWWKEWRTRRIDAGEYHRLNVDCPFQEWLLEERYLCRLPDGRTVAKFQLGALADAVANPVDPDDVWMPWQLGKSRAAVIDAMLGDTSFFEAKSLCETHGRLVAQLRTIRTADRAAHDAKQV